MQTTDVLVVGAGPAGSIAALSLAREGIRTILVEAKRFPREKVCGDGIIPDSIKVLGDVGLLDQVRAIAHRAEQARLFAPSGKSFTLRAPLLTLRRERLDALLAEAAVESGVELMEEVAIKAPIRRGNAVAGARGRTRAGKEIEIHAPITILATGAASGMLAAFGVQTRSQPSALALRAYYRAPNIDEQEMVISYEKQVMPGYGWVFPMGNGEANVGVGVFLDDGRTGTNLKSLFQRFTERCPHVRHLLADAEPLGPLRGAPLRCNLEGAKPAAPGLLVAGEALGTTYAYTGEGIGKAMESGRIAARVAASCMLTGRADAWSLGAYTNALAAADFPEKFRRYRVAQKWIAHQPVVDFITWRANRSERVRTILEGVVSETRSPDELLSLTGLFRALIS
jgi:geranylgeranyl reductase family protein